MNLEKTTQQLLASELFSYKVDVATLSKTRFPDEATQRKESDSISSGENGHPQEKCWFLTT